MMASGKTSRRRFLQQSAAAGVALSGMTAASYGRVKGANERINVGLIGCGGRGQYIVKHMLKPADDHSAVIAVCDIWKQHQNGYPAEVEKLYGKKPAVYGDYRKLLANDDIDAVIIATPAHQHCGQTIDAVTAGKHVYVEKPIASVMCDLEILNKCHDVVSASELSVQNGSQGVTCPGARALKEFIASQELGKLFRIESTETHTRPYWVRYSGPKTKAETDWKAFLYNRKDRPFNAHMHASWMGYHDFSSGTIGGWMAHFINLVHFVTDCDLPRACTTFGGRYALSGDPRCTAPDQVTVILEYGEGFYTQFVTHFGSDIDNETTLFMFEKGVVKCKFGHDIGNPVYSSEGVNQAVADQKMLEKDPPQSGPAHVKNWLKCAREGGSPNANMDFGYKQGVAVLMGDASYSLERKVRYDKASRTIKSCC